jgi:hypothetical protein
MVHGEHLPIVICQTKSSGVQSGREVMKSRRWRAFFHLASGDNQRMAPIAQLDRASDYGSEG